MRTIPSVIEYSVCSLRWTKDGDVTGIPMQIGVVWKTWSLCGLSDDFTSDFLPDFIAPTTSGFYRLCSLPERFLNELCRINALADCSGIALTELRIVMPPGPV
jgi:hypothetical protein